MKISVTKSLIRCLLIIFVYTLKASHGYINGFVTPKKAMVPKNTLSLSPVPIDMDLSSQLLASISIHQPHMMMNSNVMAGTIADVSHVVLGMSAYLLNSETSMVVPFFLLMGRVLGVMSDYIPDHSMKLDDLAFHAILLSLDLSVLAKCALVKSFIFLHSSQTSLTDHDDKAFEHIFEPAGFSFLQYKTLRKSNVIQWEQLVQDDSSTEENDQCMSWVYNSATKSFEDRSKRENLLASVKLLRSLDERNVESFKQPQLAYKNGDDESVNEQKWDYHKGDGRLVSLKLNTKQMLNILDNDKDIFSPMHSLIVSNIRQNLKHQYTSKIVYG